MNSNQRYSRETGDSEQLKRDYWRFISYRHADNKEPSRSKQPCAEADFWLSFALCGRLKAVSSHQKS